MNEESTDNIPDDIDDQQEDISPPTPRIRPIIAPDMFPPFVENFFWYDLDAIGLISSPLVVCENPQDYPESYRSNSKKEELILTYVENFRRQYHYIYRDRKPLLLNPLNECAVSVSIPNFLSSFSARFFSN